MKRIITFAATIALLMIPCEAIFHFKVKCERPTYAFFHNDELGCVAEGRQTAWFGFENNTCVSTPDSIVYDSKKIVVSASDVATVSSYTQSKTCSGSPSMEEFYTLNTCKNSSFASSSEIVKKMTVPLATYESEDSDCTGDYTGIFAYSVESGACVGDKRITCSADLKTYRIEEWKSKSQNCEGKAGDDDRKDLEVNKCYDKSWVSGSSTLRTVSSFIVVVCGILFL
jgi:hypothetical protein